MAIYSELFGQHLRLGNFLFEFAANLKLSLVHNTQAVYPDWYYLWKYLENPPFTYTKEPMYGEIIRPMAWGWTQEEEDYINGLDYSKDVIFALNHFRQSSKWFEGYEKEVINSLKAKNEIYIKLFGKYKNFFTEKPTIGIGIRLGDFKNHGTFFQISHSWYIKALEAEFPNWRENYTVVVFSDDIPEAKGIFKKYPFQYADPNETHTHKDNFKYYHGDASEQFFLGTMMDNFIIGNSTFSWWQAFLATWKQGSYYPQNINKGKVVHCGEVFHPKGNHKHCDISNYYHSSWKLVKI